MSPRLRGDSVPLAKKSILAWTPSSKASMSSRSSDVTRRPAVSRAEKETFTSRTLTLIDDDSCAKSETGMSTESAVKPVTSVSSYQIRTGGFPRTHKQPKVRLAARTLPHGLKISTHVYVYAGRADALVRRSVVAGEIGAGRDQALEEDDVRYLSFLLPR